MNLPYSKALEMKAAGFPQEGAGTYLCGERGCEEHEDHAFNHGLDTYSPLLEEVISELPRYAEEESKYWFTLQHEGAHWTAGYLWYDTWHPTMDAEGSTPLEACCNLWLVLNPKPQE